MTTAAEAVILPPVLEKATDGISVSQAAEQLGVKRQTVLNWIKAGKLPATRFGYRFFIDPADLEKVRRPA